MEEREKDLAICQMWTLYTVLSWGGMDIDVALQQLGLDNDECLKLAEAENLGWIADNIRLIKEKTITLQADKEKE